MKSDETSSGEEHCMLPVIFATAWGIRSAPYLNLPGPARRDLSISLNEQHPGWRSTQVNFGTMSMGAYWKISGGHLFPTVLPSPKIRVWRLKILRAASLPFVGVAQEHESHRL
jgi:hypothetical protein